MGIAMGATAVALIYSPWGRRSGAHMNPAVTITFWRLGKIAGADAVMYLVAQIAGGLAGIVLASVVLRQLPADPSVNYVATIPGSHGAGIALLAETAISFWMMFVVLVVSNDRRFSRLTGICAGLLVCIYIVVEAPLSGMSMNPARSFGPALLAGSIDSMWIYVTGPVAGMLLAGETFVWLRGSAGVLCAKLDHPAGRPCIFRCRFRACAAVSVARAGVNEVSA
jgi:aquaporin Z